MPLYKVTYTETRECVSYFHADSASQARKQMQSEPGDDGLNEIKVTDVREVKIPATGPIRLDANFHIIEED